MTYEEEVLLYVTKPLVKNVLVIMVVLIIPKRFLTYVLVSRRQVLSC